MRILLWPDPMLKKVSEPYGPPDNHLPSKSFVEEMYQLMKEAGGVGLSAIQVGVAKRLVIADLGEGLEVYINPEIADVVGSRIPMREGCLSTPGMFETVRRYNEIYVRALTPVGPDSATHYNKTVTGLRAQMFQHEIEHMDGKMYLDHVNPAARDRVRAQMRKLKGGKR